MGLKESDFVNNSTDFAKVTFVVTDGSLTIEKRTVTLGSATASKVYDGTALTSKDITVGGDEFVDGEGATYDVTGSQTAVGSSDNTFTYELNKNTKAGNYTITTSVGTLTVTPQSITPDPENPDSYKGITINDPSDHVYDGQEHKWSPTVKDADDKALTEGRDYTVSYKYGTEDKNFKDVQTITVTITGQGNYKGTVTKTYKITKRKVKLTSASDQKVYDGQPLTNKNVTASTGKNEGFVNGEGATYDVTGSQTTVGSSANKFTYTLNANTKAANYEITTEEGILTVISDDKEVVVQIKGNTKTEKYDGTAKTVNGYEIVSISKDNFTDVSTIKVTIKGKGNYTGTVTKEYKITPRPVTLTSADAKKVYDGKALTKEEVVASRGENEGFVGNDGADYNVTGTQTVVGTSKNTFGYTLKSGTLAKNYAITKVEGILEVTPVTDKVTVTIQENSGKFTYDGTEKTVKGYEVESISNKLYSENDFSFSGKDTVKGTDAGTYDMELTAKDFANNNANFSNVEFIIKDGTLKIDKKDVTLTSASATKMYDGKALTKDEVTAEGFVGNDGATYNVTGSQTEVGKSDNTFTYELKKGTNPDNYNIKTVNGELEVTPSDQKVVVTIKENSGKETYDGREKTVTGYTVENISSKLPYAEKDFEFNGDATVKGTNAGTYNMELKPGDFKNINKNFSNVSFEIIDGTLTIDKRDVTLTSASDSKAYDGTALENKNVTAEGFVGNDGATYNVTGSQTEVGSSDNIYIRTEQRYKQRQLQHQDCKR